MIEKVVLYLLGVASTGVGLLILRWLRKDHIPEELARRKSAADLLAHLRSIGVSMDDATALLGTLGRKRGELSALPAKQELTIEEQIEAREFAAIEAANSQGQMNQLQAERSRRLDRRMNDVLDKLRHALHDDTMLPRLEASQVAWLEYRDKECDFAGARFEGGTMRPLIVGATFSALTKTRAEALESELKLIADLEGR